MIEVHTFRLAPGVDASDFLAADRRVQTELSPFQPGFIRRTTARGSEPGQWAVVTLWASEKDGDAAQAALAVEDVGRSFLRLIDPESLQVARYFELPG